MHFWHSQKFVLREIVLFLSAVIRIALNSSLTIGHISITLTTH